VLMVAVRVIDTVSIVRGAGSCTGRVSVRLSVCLICRQQQRRPAGLLLSALRAGDIDQQLRSTATGPQHGARQQLRAV